MTEPAAERSRWLHVAAHLLAAVALGIYADVGFDASAGWQQVPLLATPWLALVFSAGRIARGSWSAPGASMVTLLTGLVAYYGWLILHQSVDPDTIVRHYRAPLWLAAGTLVGAGFGLLARLSRTGNRVARTAAWSVVAAVPAVDFIRTVGRDESPVVPVLVCLVAVAIAVCVWAVRAGRLRVGQLLVWSVLSTVMLWQAQLAGPSPSLPPERLIGRGASGRTPSACSHVVSDRSGSGRRRSAPRSR